MKKTILLLVVFLSSIGITVYSQEDLSKIQILEESVRISSVNDIQINTGYGKAYYNDKEIATVDQTQQTAIDTSRFLKKGYLLGENVNGNNFCISTPMNGIGFSSDVNNDISRMDIYDYTRIFMWVEGQSKIDINERDININPYRNIDISPSTYMNGKFTYKGKEVATVDALNGINSNDYSMEIYHPRTVSLSTTGADGGIIIDNDGVWMYSYGGGIYSNGEPIATVDQIPKPINYSTTEQKTGQKWVDGKDVYQRTLTGIITEWENQHFSVPFTKTATGTIIKFEGFLDTDGNIFALNSHNNNSVWGGIEFGRYACWYDNYGNISGDPGFSIKDVDNWDYSNDFKYIIHVYYTK